MAQWFALIAFVIVVLFGTSSSLLVTFGKKSKSASNVQLKNNTGKPCATDIDCSTLPNTSCIKTDMDSSECLCQDLEPPRFGQCMLMPKELHITCTDDQDCVNHGIVAKSIECRNSTCHCKVGYFAVADIESCEQVTFLDAVAHGVSTSFSSFLLVVANLTVFLTGTAFRKL